MTGSGPIACNLEDGQEDEIVIDTSATPAPSAAAGGQDESGTPLGDPLTLSTSPGRIPPVERIARTLLVVPSAADQAHIGRVASDVGISIRNVSVAVKKLTLLNAAANQRTRLKSVNRFLPRSTGTGILKKKVEVDLSDRDDRRRRRQRVKDKNKLRLADTGHVRPQAVTAVRQRVLGGYFCSEGRLKVPVWQKILMRETLASAIAYRTGTFYL